MAVPVKVVVTGAAGHVAYSLLYSIASGEVFGREQPVTLALTDVPPLLGVLDGVAMELQDCTFQLLQGVTVTDLQEVAFRDVDVAVLLGAVTSREGTDSSDTFRANVRMFRSQGQALDAYAKKTVKVLVVGSPANTNCLVAMTAAPSIPRENFSCLTRLGQNQAQAQLALRLGTGPGSIRNVIIWGSQSGTWYPDMELTSVTHGSLREGLRQALGDAQLLPGDANMHIQHQGRTLKGMARPSGAMAVASAICDHLRALWSGTQEGELVSMGVISNGNSYGVPEHLIYSFPVTVQEGSWQIVPGLRVSDVSQRWMAQSAQELLAERERALRALAKSHL
ncbi:malate dehydrogenase, cytoplasmic-like isoform X1 [Mustelus asterias]